MVVAQGTIVGGLGACHRRMSQEGVHCMLRYPIHKDMETIRKMYEQIECIEMI